MPHLNNPWHSKTVIRVLAIVDMIFGTLLFVLYLGKFFWPSVNNGQFIPSYPVRLILLLPMTINIIQIVMAYNLLISVVKFQDPLVAIARATMWFQVAVVILTLLCLKLFIMLMFSPNPKGEPLGGMMITLAEIVFKTFSLYVVKEFTENLRQSLNSGTQVQFITVYSPGYNGVPFSPSPTVFV